MEHKNILIISASPRIASNSSALVGAFAEGAIESGAEVEYVSLRNADLGFCRGCLACQSTGSCVINDDAGEIVRKMHDADVLAFATPVYYNSVSGQLKTMLDRANPLFSADYKFRDIYLFTVAAEADEQPEKGPLETLRGWASCFPKAKIAGHVFAGGAAAPGDIKGHPALMTAYETGKAV